MDLRALSRPLRARLSGDERGIMIIEVVVSAVLVVVMSLATLAVIDRAGALSGENRARSVATGLAQQDQDKVRQWPWARVSDMFGASQAAGETRKLYADPGRPVDIDGLTYTVQTVLEVVTDNEQNSACLAGWQNRKIQITTTATAPPGIKIKPVQMRTFRVPTISTAQDEGAVIVRLTRANGQVTPNVPVRLSGTASGAKTTDSDGCAFFTGVPPGKITVEWGLAGGGGTLVDENGADLVSRTVTLLGGSTAQFAGRFDDAQNPPIQFVDENGNTTTPDGQLIRWNAVSVVNPGISTVYNGWRSWKFASANQFTIPGLFPFESEYGVFAGTCWGNDPTIWGAPSVTTNTMLRNSTASGVVKVLMPTVTFNLPGAGYRVFVAPERRVTKMGTGKCTPNKDNIMSGILPAGADAANQAAPVKQSTATGIVQYALPYGIWRVCVDNPGTGKRVNDNKVKRINNTPNGTPGSNTDPRQYAPLRSVTYAAADITTNGACPSSQDSKPWLDYTQPQNPTDP